MKIERCFSFSSQSLSLLFSSDISGPFFPFLFFFFPNGLHPVRILNHSLLLFCFTHFRTHLVVINKYNGAHMLTWFFVCKTRSYHLSLKLINSLTFTQLINTPLPLSYANSCIPNNSNNLYRREWEEPRHTKPARGINLHYRMCVKYSRTDRKKSANNVTTWPMECSIAWTAL